MNKNQILILIIPAILILTLVFCFFTGLTITTSQQIADRSFEPKIYAQVPPTVNLSNFPNSIRLFEINKSMLDKFCTVNVDGFKESIKIGDDYHCKYTDPYLLISLKLFFVKQYSFWLPIPNINQTIYNEYKIDLSYICYLESENFANSTLGTNELLIYNNGFCYKTKVK